MRCSLFATTTSTKENIPQTRRADAATHRLLLLLLKLLLLIKLLILHRTAKQRGVHPVNGVVVISVTAAAVVHRVIIVTVRRK